MQRTLIKICGVRDAATAAVAVKHGADFVGLVFVEQSPRHISLGAARDVATTIHGAGAQAVGLFVDDDAARVRDVAAKVGLDMVQLHGHESPQMVAQVAELGVFKVVREPAEVARYANVKAVMFDAPPHGDELPGGTGRAFDWHALTHTDRADWPPFIVAGGLTSANVSEAIALIHPWAVDVSSGVESSRGVKDHDKIKAFCDAVRKADENA
jgi:phosphoribosylanthranilate isomerase